MNSCDNTDILTNRENMKYSVLSFLEGQEKIDHKEQPLDLSLRSEKSTKESENNVLNISSFKDSQSNETTSRPFLGLCDPINMRKMQSFIQCLINQTSKSDKKDTPMSNQTFEWYKHFGEAFRKRSELNYASQISNFDSLNSAAWRFAFRHTGHFQFPDQCLGLPTMMFPSLQDSRRYFPEVSSRPIYKFLPRDSGEKIPNSMMMSDRENISRMTDSPQCSNSKRRRRTKVTDSRLLKRISTETNSNIHLDESALENCIENRCSSTSQSSISEDASNDPKKYTLTPIHLRKAKLMFLYTRYPNSQMLKNFFPDIIFYKQNTAQLVKWFSNFREFYYSEMEKAVQRSISSGIKYSSELFVTEDCELFKNLMTHFNKNRQIEVPKEFMITVQITLREFFEAFSVGKNLHQSWKKPIYKNIAKLDQPLPEFFKDFNWMLELAKEDNGTSHSS